MAQLAFGELYDEAMLPMGQDSSIRLRGTATMTDWSCLSQDVHYRIQPVADIESVSRLVTGPLAARDPGAAQQVAAWAESTEIYRYRIALRARIDAFECGSQLLEADMRKAMNVAHHPYVEYSFTRLVGSSLRDREGRPEIVLQLEGILTLAGESRRSVMEMVAFVDDRNRLRFQGHEKIRMTDFLIRPPTGFFGLVKAHDPVNIEYDFVVPQADGDTPDD